MSAIRDLDPNDAGGEALDIDAAPGGAAATPSRGGLRFVTFSIRPGEYDRLRQLARSFGYAHVGPMAAELFSIGLRTASESFEPATVLRRLGARARRGAPNGDESTRASRPRARRATVHSDHEG